MKSPDLVDFHIWNVRKPIISFMLLRNKQKASSEPKGFLFVTLLSINPWGQ